MRPSASSVVRSSSRDGADDADGGASPEGAHVTGSKTGEIKLSMKALSSLYTGFRSARLLAAWGLIEGSDDAIRRADAIFSTRHAPHCPDHF